MRVCVCVFIIIFFFLGGGGHLFFIFGSNSGAFITNVCLWVRHWSFFPVWRDDKLLHGVIRYSSMVAFPIARLSTNPCYIFASKGSITASIVFIRVTCRQLCGFLYG